MKTAPPMPLSIHGTFHLEKNMKRPVAFLFALGIGLAIYVSGLTHTYAQSGSGSEKPGHNSSNPLSLAVSHITGLSDDQQSKIKRELDGLDQDIANWLPEANARTGAFHRLLADDPHNANAMEMLTAQTFKYNSAYQNLVAVREFNIQSILTPAQATEWHAYQLTSQTEARFADLGLDEPQRQKLLAQVQGYAKKLAGAKDKDELATMRAGFWKDAVSLLTPLQISQIFAPTFPLRGVPHDGDK